MSDDEAGAAIAGRHEPSDAMYWTTADPGNPLADRTKESDGGSINIAGGGDLAQTLVRQARLRQLPVPKQVGLRPPGRGDESLAATAPGGLRRAIRLAARHRPPPGA